MKLFIEPTRKTHLMQSISISMQETLWSSAKERVVIEPLEATIVYVDLKIGHCRYVGNIGRTKDTKVRFYFDGRNPIILNGEKDGTYRKTV